MGQHFLFANATNSGIRFIHADILDVVQFAEDAQLRKFRDACQEHETQIRVARLEWAVEIPHYVPKRGQVLLLIHHIEKRGVIFVYQNNNLPAGLSISTSYKTL